jgi:CRP/FNR family transcriptional regulator, cyclic AMP receptor protein
MASAYSPSRAHRTSRSTPLDEVSMAGNRAASFTPKTFLTRASEGRTTLQCQKHQTLFTQGDAATAVFYILEGRVKLTVISRQGKGAVVAILGSGDFFGEACLAGQPSCMATATSLDASTVVRIDKATMNRVLYDEPAFAELFMVHLLTRNSRIQDDLIDQLFNSAEKRLARALLLLAHSGNESAWEQVIPKISQETLAEMVGTTRSRVSFFMNRFKKLGFIECNAGLHVNSALLSTVLAA